ncbi:CIC11C00000003674 [Sungouiella intermedia]|uniref:CIC11C00000003674 n=1 Tax=Sungouiella intermedia TaxID=45354 RepID=A0A1L0CZS0_9ASCO|nr:CIC11C00000003674 [[Candida] intermedia]
MFSVFRPIAFRNLKVAVPVILSTTALLRPQAIIHNDAFAVSQPQQHYLPQAIQAKARTSRLNGKLDYGELCLGSLTGLFLGVVVGKLSSVLVFVSVSTYLLLQFLENRGMVTIPWTSILNIGNRQWDLKLLFFDKPSFKISLVSSFLIAAYNV